MLMTAEARLPIKYWSPGWIFRQILDTFWWELTGQAANRFPATFRKDQGHFGHPGYVLAEIGDYQITLCPMSTRHHGKRYVRAGTRLEVTGHIFDKDSYLVESALINLPRKAGLFADLPRFLGICPPDKLAGKVGK